ncbi:unnamed protein product [Periconia digitata]|uniref:Uncharacterized protein n=1 Tax=Periconia digitata TaxID=1303443 RepID=A0A9W4UK31_9PLEO|nr:unnamed protein product [Periconia digitata]
MKLAMKHAGALLFCFTVLITESIGSQTNPTPPTTTSRQYQTPIIVPRAMGKPSRTTISKYRRPRIPPLGLSTQQLRSSSISPRQTQSTSFRYPPFYSQQGAPVARRRMESPAEMLQPTSSSGGIEAS